MKFGADGLLYVLDDSSTSNRVMRFTESSTYAGDYVPNGAGGMDGPAFMSFGPNGDLYVSTTGNNQIFKFGTENEAVFTVSLSTPLAEPVTVNYATTDGTALAGTNYTAGSGTLTFPAGITTQTIRVPIVDSGSQTTALTFTVNLSNPVAATLSQSQATGTIAPSDQKAKFYVVNDATPALGGTNTAYKAGNGNSCRSPTQCPTVSPDRRPVLTRRCKCGCDHRPGLPNRCSEHLEPERDNAAGRIRGGPPALAGRPVAATRLRCGRCSPQPG